MARDYSSAWHRTVNAVSAIEAPVLALEITHPDLAEPIRVVNDTQNLVHDGNTFIALGFEARLPDDLEQGLPRAQLRVDNVERGPDEAGGKSLAQWLEDTGGGQGATVRMLQLLRSDPDTIEFEVTVDLTDVRVTATSISGTLGFADILNLPAVARAYRPDTAPGIF